MLVRLRKEQKKVENESNENSASTHHLIDFMRGYIQGHV